MESILVLLLNFFLRYMLMIRYFLDYMLKNKNKKIKKIVVHLISKWLGSQKIIIIMIV